MKAVNKDDKRFEGKRLSDIMSIVAVMMDKKYGKDMKSGKININNFFIDTVTATTECWDAVMSGELELFKRNVTRKLIPAVKEKVKRGEL